MAKRLGYTKRDIKSINATIGLNLRAARHNAGMTQKQVMEAVWGVSNTSNRVSEIENGRKDLTLVDLLIFQNLYGQSLDYICGLSTEPEVDMLAGTVNHVVNQSHSLIEMMVGEMAGVLVGHMKSINENDHAALLSEAKGLCAALSKEQTSRKAGEPVAYALGRLTNIVRKIEVDQARKVNAVDMQMTQIAERIDKQDGHHLLKDRNQHYQYSIPLPMPEALDENVGVGVDFG